MTQDFKTYSVRIPKGPISDFVDESGNGVYLRRLFYQNLGTLEALRFRDYLTSKELSIDVCKDELPRYAFSEVWAKQIPKVIKKSKIIFILCEGETEVCYFKDFATCAHATHKVKVKKGIDTAPLRLVEEAEKILLFDQSHDRKLLEIWVVFDRDRHISYKAAFEEASKFPQIKIAWTNPCFEFWLLLHFRSLKQEDCNKTIRFTNPLTGKREEVIDYSVFTDKLAEFLPGYRKADRYLFSNLRSKTPKALGRASFNQVNPTALGSSVSLLIQRLCQFLVIQKNFWDKCEIPVPKDIKERNDDNTH